MNRNRKPTLSDVRESILSYFLTYAYRPIWIGQIAIVVGRSCEEAEAFLDELAEAGDIRSQTSDGIKTYRLVTALKKTALRERLGVPGVMPAILPAFWSPMGIIILIDVDEVLADFQGAAFDVIARVTGRRHSREECKQWEMFGQFLQPEERKPVFAEIRKPGFCSALSPLPGAQEGVKRLQELGEVYAVTSPFRSEPWVHERTKWLEDHFGIQESNVVFTSAKFLVTGDVLLDDRPDHILKWEAKHPHGHGLLWHLPNTAGQHDDIDRVHTWDEVIRRVRRIVRIRRRDRELEEECQRHPWAMAEILSEASGRR